MGVFLLIVKRESIFSISSRRVFDCSGEETAAINCPRTTCPDVFSSSSIISAPDAATASARSFSNNGRSRKDKASWLRYEEFPVFHRAETMRALFFLFCACRLGQLRWWITTPRANETNPEIESPGSGEQHPARRKSTPSSPSIETPAPAVWAPRLLGCAGAVLLARLRTSVLIIPLRLLSDFSLDSAAWSGSRPALLSAFSSSALSWMVTNPDFSICCPRTVNPFSIFSRSSDVWWKCLICERALLVLTEANQSSEGPLRSPEIISTTSPDWRGLVRGAILLLTLAPIDFSPSPEWTS